MATASEVKKQRLAGESGIGRDDDVVKCFRGARRSSGMIVAGNVELATAAERERPWRRLTEAVAKRTNRNSPQQVRRRAEDYERGCMHEGLDYKPVPCSCWSRN